MHSISPAVLWGLPNALSPQTPFSVKQDSGLALHRSYRFELIDDNVTRVILF